MLWPTWSQPFLLLIATTYATFSPTSLFIDYIYLDTDERRRFAQASHEYLIEQLQFTGDESVTATNAKIKLNFNHPCKELVWVVQRDANILQGSTRLNQWSNYTDAVDTDGSWGTLQNAGLYSNVESGFSGSSFPRFRMTDVTGAPDTGNNAGVWSLLDAGTIAGGGNDATNFPGNFGPGAQVPPTNFGALTAAGDGADHAGTDVLNAGHQLFVPNSNSTDTTDSKGPVLTSTLSNLFNITPTYLPLVSTYTPSHSNQKNTNHLVLAT